MQNTPQRPSRRFSARPSGTPPPVGPDDVAKQLALRDVMEYAVRVTRETVEAKPMKSWRSRPIVLTAVASLSVVLCTYTFLGRPEWIYGPDPVRLEPVRRDAYLRYALYLTSQRVAEYRSRRGALPASLAEAGPAWAGITYRVISDSVFELRVAPDSGIAIVFRSDQSLPDFLGASLPLIRPRR